MSRRRVLFAGSVRSNVSYGDRGQGEITDAEVRNAVSIAQGAEFVEVMEGAYDAPIAQGGTNVSGGQKQRLAIARAVAGKPEIFLFDDSFSALDYKTDRALRKALGEQTKDATKIIVAQRIGTIRHADRILVLEHGKIVGAGTHAELMKSCPTYRDIADSQLSKEELQNG